MTSINFQMLIECGKHADAMVYTMVHHQSFNLETPNQTLLFSCHQFITSICSITEPTVQGTWYQCLHLSTDLQDLGLIQAWSFWPQTHFPKFT